MRCVNGIRWVFAATIGISAFHAQPLFAEEPPLPSDKPVSDAAPTPTSARPASVEILPGRLGTGLALGLLGVFTGISGGAIVSSVPLAHGGSPQLWIGGIGASAVTLGVAGGVGGYLLAEHLEFDEADARLIGSSLFWGAAMGGYVGFGTADAIPNGISRYNVAAGVGVPLGTTWVAGIAGAAVASQLELTTGKVALLNSGGMIGWLWGQTIAMHLKYPTEPNTGGPDILELAFAQSLPMPAGLLVGGLLAGVLDLTWGEALLCDLGGVLGLVAGGAVTMATFTGWGPNLEWAAAGASAGWGFSLVGMTLWRAARGADVAPSGSGGAQAGAWRLTLPALLDREGRPVTALGVQGVF